MEIYNALPYDITKRIRQNIVSEDDINDGKDSFYIYKPNGKVEIRISNHCTHLWTWHERRNGKFDDITRISIVFEESDTYSDANLVLRRHRNTPLMVQEFVYRIGDPQAFTPSDVKLVINEIQQCIKKGKMYEDPTGKLEYSEMRVSENPPTNENINCNINMKTNKVRLTEGQLRRVVAESVKRVLRETCEYAVLDNEGEVVASFKDEAVANEFLQDNSDWCDEVVPIGTNGFIKPYEDANDDDY